MDSPGEIFELCEIAEPRVGVVLNIGLTHVSKLGSIDAVAREKLSLVRYLPAEGTAVLNIEDPRVAAVGELRAGVISFGPCETATLRRGPITDLGLDGTRFEVTYGGARADVRSPLPGAHVAVAALAAIGAALALGMTLDEAAAAVSQAEVPGRISQRRTAAGATILDDRYNSSPASLAGALELLRGLPGRRIALIGKIAELGEHEFAEHQRAGRLAASCSDILISFGEITRPLVESAREAGAGDARWFADKEAAARAVAELLRAGDFVLVKGSRSEALETVIPLLENAG
jgi:UDP-N-acetylmuramoyl-tripeptide--D-alanyl-D-alanine ligase